MEDSDHLWCATELDEDGSMTHYGWCSETCAPVGCHHCKFPFVYNGTEYNSCTMEDSDHMWCAPELDEDGGMQEYGWCSETCALEVGCGQCQFPFMYNGTEYTSCATEDADRPWCATELDEIGRAHV